jgi:hypothetical protein
MQAIQLVEQLLRCWHLVLHLLALPASSPAIAMIVPHKQLSTLVIETNGIFIGLTSEMVLFLEYVQLLADAMVHYAASSRPPAWLTSRIDQLALFVLSRISFP